MLDHYRQLPVRRLRTKQSTRQLDVTMLVPLVVLLLGVGLAFALFGV